ncbi:hypothetical protein AGDE_14291 [Angomonas deanei]|nr:hypothetical protein AGDE_14291 [Angomonas deanei]|eukprot:EPY21100.1 hypothetical protein AGDE_14291 [Angomonas deanei]
MLSIGASIMDSATPSFLSPPRIYGGGDQSQFSSIISSPNVVLSRGWNGAAVDSSVHERSASPVPLSCAECHQRRMIIESLKRADTANVQNIETLQQSLQQVTEERDVVLARNTKLLETLESARLQDLVKEREFRSLQNEVARLADKLEHEQFEHNRLKEGCVAEQNYFLASSILFLECLEESQRTAIASSCTLWYERTAHAFRNPVRKPPVSAPYTTAASGGRASVYGCGMPEKGCVSPRYAPSSAARSCRHEKVAVATAPSDERTTIDALEAQLRSASLRISTQQERISELFEQAQLVEEMQVEIEDLILNELCLRETVSRQTIEGEQCDQWLLVHQLFHSSPVPPKPQSEAAGLADTPALVPSFGAASKFHKYQMGYKRRHVDPLCTGGEEVGTEVATDNTFPNPFVSSQWRQDPSAEIMSALESIQSKLDCVGAGDSSPSAESGEREWVRGMEDSLRHLYAKVESLEAPLTRLSGTQDEMWIDLKKGVSGLLRVQNEIFLKVSAMSFALEGASNPTPTVCNAPSKEPSTQSGRYSLPGISPDRREGSQPSSDVSKGTSFPMPVFSADQIRLQRPNEPELIDDVFNPSAISFNTLPSHVFDIVDSDDEHIPPVPSIGRKFSTR